MRAEHDRILAAVGVMWSVPVEALRGASRAGSVSFPRFVAMWLMRKRCGVPLTRIGEWVGHRDHTSILHGCRRIEATLKHDSGLAKQIERIEASLAADDEVITLAEQVEMVEVITPKSTEPSVPAATLAEIRPGSRPPMLFGERVTVVLELPCPRCGDTSRATTTAMIDAQHRVSDVASPGAFLCNACERRRRRLSASGGPSLSGQAAHRATQVLHAIEGGRA